MRVLYITSNNVPYAPVSGGQAASLAILQMYANIADVDLVALSEVTDAGIDMRRIESLCQSVTIIPTRLLFARHHLHHAAMAVHSVISRQSFKLLKFRVKTLRDTLIAMSAERTWDIVHFDSLAMSQYAPLFADSHRVLLQQNVEWEIFERHAHHQSFGPLKWFSFVEARRLRTEETRLASGVDLVCTLSDRDAALMAGAGCRAKIRTLRLPPFNSKWSTQGFDRTEPLLVSLGNLTSLGRQEGTLWFARSIWPKVRRDVPNAKWKIIGANPPPSIRALDRRDGIEVVGFAPDLDLALSGVRACVIPLHIGGGIRIKILEMFARGIPCVATTVGAQGFSVEAESDILLADEPGDFAQAVVRVLTDPTVFSRLVDGGRGYLARNHGEADCQKTFEETLFSTLPLGGLTQPI